MGKKNRARQAKNFRPAPATHHPNRRLLLGISVALILGAMAILGKQSENTSVAHGTNVQKPLSTDAAS
jgi:hypothetical protein